MVFAIEGFHYIPSTINTTIIAAPNVSKLPLFCFRSSFTVQKLNTFAIFQSFQPKERVCSICMSKHWNFCTFAEQKTYFDQGPLCPLCLHNITLQKMVVLTSGVAKLGHTGAHALATRGRAPPVQALLKIIGTECTVINRELGVKSAQRC